MNTLKNGNPRRFWPLLIIIFFYTAAFGQAPQLYKFNQGKVTFKSEAPLELISAGSEELRGLIDLSNWTFAFTVPVNTFRGFNSTLQQEHFNENYLESTRFPRASFSGRIIEEIDPSRSGEQVVRAKGKLLIHGVEHERIIRSVIEIQNGVISIHTIFTVLLEDHRIEIPKVVKYKIAEEITVEITAKALSKP